MSTWSYLRGTVEVRPEGETQAEKLYTLQTVLAHMPVIHGSERPMDIYINRKNGYNAHCNVDELGECNTEQMEWYDTDKVQDAYILTLDGAFRDKDFPETKKEFQCWIYTLAERLFVEDVFVKIEGWNKSEVFDKDYSDIWRKNDEPNWVDENTLWGASRNKKSKTL